jgi:hypothetical protein
VGIRIPATLRQRRMGPLPIRCFIRNSCDAIDQRRERNKKGGARPPKLKGKRFAGRDGEFDDALGIQPIS